MPPSNRCSFRVHMATRKTEETTRPVKSWNWWGFSTRWTSTYRTGQAIGTKRLVRVNPTFSASRQNLRVLTSIPVKFSDWTSSTTGLAAGHIKGRNDQICHGVSRDGGQEWNHFLQVHVLANAWYRRLNICLILFDVRLCSTTILALESWLIKINQIMWAEILRASTLKINTLVIICLCIQMTPPIAHSLDICRGDVF